MRKKRLQSSSQDNATEGEETRILPAEPEQTLRTYEARAAQVYEESFMKKS